MNSWKKALPIIFFVSILVTLLTASFLPSLIVPYLPETVTREVFMALLVLTIAIFLFISEWVRVDVVGLLMMVGLPLLGLVSPSQALSGMSSNAVISIIAVIIIGAGLDKTGSMNILARQITRFAGKSEMKITTLIAGTVAIISGFMQNIGAAALFLPVTTRISKQVGVPISRILMPMGYCAIIGGCLTLVGSSPLILLNDLMDGWWANNQVALETANFSTSFEAFGLFSVTPIGIALVIGALLYFMLFGKFLLPGKAQKEGEQKSMFLTHKLNGTYKDRVGEVFELSVPDNFKSQAIRELKLREEHLCAIFSIIRKDKKTKLIAPVRSQLIEAGDTVSLVGTLENVKKVASSLGWKLQSTLDLFAEDLSPTNAGVLEGILTPRSELVGLSLREFEIRKKHRIIPLVVFRQGKIIVKNLSNIPLESGDAILLYGQWADFHLIKKSSDFVFTEKIKGEILRPEKAKYAVFFLALALFLAMALGVKLSIALLTGAIGMILTRVLSIDEAYRSVDWMTIFLLAGLIPLGIAFETTGAAKFIADSIMLTIGTPTPLLLLIVISILTSFFTLVASNVGATVLLVPLAMNLALQIGLDPRVAALTVGVAASNTFILPTHQVNALIMRPGGYRTMDYLKAGAGMTILFLVIMISMLVLMFGI